MATNMAPTERTDRRMWFSMWFLGAITTYGFAFFPMFYYSVDRRNRHLQRQQEFEKKVAAFYKKDWNSTSSPKRNARLWAASIILVFPVFAISYLLSKDLNEHEKHQAKFLTTFHPNRKYIPQTISVKTCAVVTIATLGLGAIYWLYKLVNLYNNHFKEQHHIEHELLMLMETNSHV